MNFLREHEDYANALLILLKFLLIVLINLQGLYGILFQLGLSPHEETGIVNTTPERQTTSNRNFNVSFYPILYGSGLTKDQYEVTVFVCGKRPGNDSNERPCQVTSQAPDVPPGPTDWDPHQTGRAPAGYRQLPETVIEDIEIQSGPQTQVDRPQRQIVDHQFRLGDDVVPGTFWMLYRVRFIQSEETHGIAEPLEVSYVLEDEPEWRIGPLQIVKGRSTRPPQSIRDFEIGLQPGSRMRMARGRLQVANYSNLPDDSFQEDVQVTTQVESVDSATSEFTVTRAGRQIQVSAREAVFLRYDPSWDRYARGEFGDLQAGHRVHFDLQDDPSSEDSQNVARLVRFGDLVVAKLTVVLQENLPPRGIYREEATGRRVRLRIPRDLFEGQLAGRRIWYFNLNRHILDPDGADINGNARVEIRRGNVSWVGGQPANYRLVWQNDRYLIQVINPRAARSEELRIRVKDEWRGVEIELLIRPMNQQTWQELGRQIPS